MIIKRSAPQTRRTPPMNVAELLPHTHDQRHSLNLAVISLDRAAQQIRTVRHGTTLPHSGRQTPLKCGGMLASYK
jgi:hypothetical protein